MSVLETHLDQTIAHDGRGPQNQPWCEPDRPVLPSEALFGSAKMLTIQHAGMDYTLRITRQGKLLLTK